jgi:monofunctional biosynthetic peptidoglycan transglycosylase
MNGIEGQAHSRRSWPFRLSEGKTFLLSAASFLLITALAKFVSVGIALGKSSSVDPFLMLDQRWVELFAAVIELAVAGLLFCGRDRRIKYLVLVWLSLLLALYRLGLWWTAPYAACSCLGILAHTESRWSVSAELVLKLALGYLFFGSLFFLACERLSGAYNRLPLGWRRLSKWGLAVFGSAALIPLLQVAWVGVRKPPTTFPMALRWMKGKLPGSSLAPNRFEWLRLKSTPTNFLTAVLIAEDTRFYRHHGFDWDEIRNAIRDAQATGRPPRGASTITQQCARSVFLWQGRSWIRKALEAYYTMLMELVLTKDQILELYVNCIEMGDGLYGIEAAAYAYYGVHAPAINDEQAAMLAAILPNPRKCHPTKPTERLVSRQAAILKKMRLAREPQAQLPLD